MEFGNDVYKTLKDLRVKAGITQQKAAKEAGLTQSHLSMIESGRRRITADLAAKLFRLYGADAAKEFLGYSAQPQQTRDFPRTEEVLGTLSQLLSETDGELAETADKYIALELYLLLRKLYLAGRYNTDRMFELSTDDISQLDKFMKNEPDRLAAFAKYSQSETNSIIEPPAGCESALRTAVNSCEDLARTLIGK